MPPAADAGPPGTRLLGCRAVPVARLSQPNVMAVYRHSPYDTPPIVHGAVTAPMYAVE